MTKQAAKSAGGQWAQGAFPPEASAKYDEVPAAVVAARIIEAEKCLEGEEWEVVDGFSFPYAKTA